MTEAKKRPFITVKEAIIASLVLLFTAIAFEKIDTTPTIPLKNILESEVIQYARQVKPILIAEIAKEIESASSKPTMMVLYASWCGYCKILIPNILALKNDGRMGDIKLLFISIDKKKEKLARYMLERGYDDVFSPTILPEESMEGFENMLIGKGLHYRGIVPYSVIFDSNGRVITEISGMANKPQLADIFEKVAKASKGF